VPATPSVILRSHSGASCSAGTVRDLPLHVRLDVNPRSARQHDLDALAPSAPARAHRVRKDAAALFEVVIASFIHLGRFCASAVKDPARRRESARHSILRFRTHGALTTRWLIVADTAPQVEGKRRGHRREWLLPTTQRDPLRSVQAIRFVTEPSQRRWRPQRRGLNPASCVLFANGSDFSRTSS
jgi:hypothetical protein